MPLALTDLSGEVGLPERVGQVVGCAALADVQLAEDDAELRRPEARQGLDRR